MDSPSPISTSANCTPLVDSGTGSRLSTRATTVPSAARCTSLTSVPVSTSAWASTSSGASSDA
jgi:hypothetical protein